MRTRIALAVDVSVALLPLAMNFACAQTWAPTGAPTNFWVAITCSADGLNLAAASGGQSTNGQIYVSSNAGTNWTPTSAPVLHWTSVASSADGARLIAAAYGSGVYTSTNFGSTWTSNNLPAASWLSVASSADGLQLFAAPYGNLRVYHSTNAGATWTTNTTALADLLSVVASAGGTLALAGDNHAHVQVSTNSGLTWSPSTTLGKGIIGNVSCVNASGAGERLMAVIFGGGIFSSTNQGLSWFSNSIPPNSSWYAAASSADGARLLVAGQKGPIYCSMDSGSTWVPNNAPGLQWQAAASSADGNAMFVVAFRGGIWGRRTNAPPRLALAPSPGGLGLSWLTPSSGLVLQQSPALGSGNWSDVTNTPNLDLTTLSRQLTVPATAGQAWYRLRSQ